MFYNEGPLQWSIKGITVNIAQKSHNLDPGNPMVKKKKKDGTLLI